jgi:hypothetical protein
MGSWVGPKVTNHRSGPLDLLVLLVLMGCHLGARSAYYDPSVGLSQLQIV